MKSCLTYGILVIYIFAATELHQLLRLPLLIQHYFEHVNEDTSMTVADFFDMHYAHGIVYDDDFEDDMKLPFKAHETVNHINVQVLAEPIKLTFDDLFFQSEFSNDVLISYAQPFIQNPVLNAIWQPPKHNGIV
jgi:hypothetical protein